MELIIGGHGGETVSAIKHLLIQSIVINRLRVYVLELFASGQKPLT